MINLAGWIENSFGRLETGTVKKTAGLSWSIRLLAVLLLADALFILAHFLLVFTPLLTNSGFYLEVDGGFGEWFQYLKYGGMIGLLAFLFRRQHGSLYLFWFALFSYLLLDDAFRLHEIVGLWLAETADLPAILGLRPQDLGELAFSALTALLLFNLLLLAYRFSQPQARYFSLWLLLLMVGLAFAGIFFDMIQVVVWRLLPGLPLLRELPLVFEEGGELIIVSLMVGLVFRHAGQVNGWPEAQIGEWVRQAAVPLAMMGVVTAVLIFIQSASPALAGNDGYYHAKMGLLLHQDGLDAARPDLPLTVLGGERFYNHHFLYHLYLGLFTVTDPALDGGFWLTRQAKNATILLAALPFLAVWWLLRGQQVRNPALWTLGLLILSGPFLYRLSMPRAQAASLLVLVIGLHWLLHKRYRLLLPLGAVYVWLYDGFPLLLLISGVYFTAVFLTERRLPWRVLLYPAAGIFLGLIINPYFPHNLSFIAHHLIAKLGSGSAVTVGNEWYPYDLWALLKNAGQALALMLAAALLVFKWRRPFNARQMTLLLLAVIFALMLFQARRFIEYFPAFALIFAAVCLSSMIEERLRVWSWSRKWLLAGSAVVLLALPVGHTLHGARSAVAGSYPADRYSAAALWLKAYSQPGSMVFQTDWDDFTRLFFYNNDARYTVGLDPTFMARQEPDLFAEWVAITRGEVEQPGPVIGERFEADYVFSDLEHDAFLQQADIDPGLKEIYRDEYAVIYAVVTKMEAE